MYCCSVLCCGEQAQRIRTRQWVHWTRVLGQVDVVATPATACTAPRFDPAAITGGEPCVLRCSTSEQAPLRLCWRQSRCVGLPPEFLTLADACSGGSREHLTHALLLWCPVRISPRSPAGSFARLAPEPNPAAHPAVLVVPRTNLRYPGESDLGLTSRVMRYVVAPNMLGFPAVSVPVGAAPVAGSGAAPADGPKPGLPVGLQLIGRPWEEATLLRASAVLEQLVVAQRLGPGLPTVHVNPLTGVSVPWP